jgi:hypothetical protein
LAAHVDGVVEPLVLLGAEGIGEETPDEEQDPASINVDGEALGVLLFD